MHQIIRASDRVNLPWIGSFQSASG